jgi:hypothetical protein
VEYGLLMSDEDRAEPEPQDSGVFGKLPSARPGVRSPRRASEGTKGRPESPTVSSDVRPPDTAGRSSAAPSPAQPGTTPQVETPGEPEAPHAGEGPGVEDLAWAGITVAAEAATLGVRLLSRALEAVRGPADRR